MKIAIITDKPFDEKAKSGISYELHAAGYDLVFLENYADKAKLFQAVADADAFIVRSDLVDCRLMDAAPQLKIIVRAGAGYDNIDLEAATERAICVMNTPGQNANAVAELVMGMMVMGVRNFYTGRSGTELKGKRLGIHAYGNVGRNVARIAAGFGMKLYAYDRYCPKEVMQADGVSPLDSPEELYASCDVVSLHVPATESTLRLVGYSLVHLMPHGGLLINTARKEIIDEEGLLKLMIERLDLRYVTDIMPDRHRDFASVCAGRYFSTPKKMGAQTAEANINAGIAAARQIVAFFAQGCEQFRVNR